MIDVLRNWLNGSRDYTAGVNLYVKLGTNEPLKKLLLKEKTKYNVDRLYPELKAIFEELSSTETITLPPIIHIKIEVADTASDSILTIQNDSTLPESAALYIACKNEAIKKYKEAMNARAVLVSMIPSDLYEDANRQDLVEARSKLAIQVVQLYDEASILFDKADYVKTHGALPNANTDAIDMATIPDSAVSRTLDNKRKNYNKITKKEPTPERVLSIQQHEKDIKILEERWHLLKEKMKA